MRVAAKINTDSPEPQSKMSIRRKNLISCWCPNWLEDGCGFVGGFFRASHFRVTPLREQSSYDARSESFVEDFAITLAVPMNETQRKSCEQRKVYNS